LRERFLGGVELYAGTEKISFQGGKDLSTTRGGGEIYILKIKGGGLTRGELHIPEAANFTSRGGEALFYQGGGMTKRGGL